MRPFLVRVMLACGLACLIWSRPAAACVMRREIIQIIKGGPPSEEELREIAAERVREIARLKRALARTKAVNRPMADCGLDCDGMTPLMLAAERGYSDIVLKLLEAKANPDLRVPRYRDGSSYSWPPYGWTARCFARAARKADSEALLVKAGSSGDAECLAEVDFLLAVRTRDVKRASQLGLRAKGKLQPKVLKVAMDQAIEDRSLGMIRAVDAAGFNPSTDIRVELSVASGVDVSMRPGSRVIITARTPMTRALESRDEKAVLALMKAGAPPPMLGRLVKSGMTSVVRHLLKAGVSPDGGEPGGNTPLIEAALARDAVLVEVLLGAGADVNLPGEGEMTPLLAALRGDKPVELALVERLLDAKADSSKADGTRTPLMEAASRCLPKAVALLLRKGARWDVLPEGGTGHYEEAVVPRLDCGERVTVQVVRALREGGVPLTPLDAAHLGWLHERARESMLLGPELYAAGLPRPEPVQPKPPPLGVR